MTEPENRNVDGTFKEGYSGNPGGRPKDSLKSYVRRKFFEMTDSQKEEFLNSIPPEVQWKMSEGNPHQGVDVKAQVTISDVLDELEDGHEIEGQELEN